MKEKFERFKEWSSRPKTKKRFYVLLAAVVILWVIYRFVAIGIENRIYVFNPARQIADAGAVVDVISAERTTGILREPLTVRNNRALVSGARVGIFKPGQKIGNGTIVSVSSDIDYDTGLYTIRTTGVADGLNYVEYRATGYFVPSYAVANNTVYVVQDGKSVARSVNVSRGDADMVVISDGISDGDMIILSRVHDGARVQLHK